jgi:threonine 3-dehydrogenase
MAILITGGTGYIGRWLAQELVAQGHEVVAFDRVPAVPGSRPEMPAESEFIGGDVTDREATIAAAGKRSFSAIIHLAGIVTMGCERDPDLAVKVNLGGTHNVLEAARINGIPRVVFASTISVWGPGVPQPMTEQTPALPLTWYGQTKLMGEHLGMFYQRREGIDFRAARLAAIVGPFRVAASGSATMYTSQILERAALGEPYSIDVDDGAATPILYAKDAAKGLTVLATAESAPRRVYILSTGRVSATELVEMARKRFPNAQLDFRPDPALAPVGRISAEWQLSVDAAAEDLGWRPAFTLETMADDLIATARGER